MSNPAWQSKKQKRIAVVLLVIAAPVLYLYARSPLPGAPSRAVAKAIGDFETAKAIKDKARGCAYAGVVVAAMIAERDTAGAKLWREQERYVCEYGF